MGTYVKTEAHRRALSESLSGNQNRLQHGDTSRTHRSPEHSAWTNMRARCLNPAHPRYADWGGRGITVCERWFDYAAFLADMGRRPSSDHQLDRIDNDGPYEPGNCRWATRSEQQQNTRRTALDVDAVAVIRTSAESVSALARRFGVDRKTIRSARDGVTWR